MPRCWEQVCEECRRKPGRMWSHLPKRLQLVLNNQTLNFKRLHTWTIKLASIWTVFKLTFWGEKKTLKKNCKYISRKLLNSLWNVDICPKKVEQWSSAADGLFVHEKQIFWKCFCEIFLLNAKLQKCFCKIFLLQVLIKEGETPIIQNYKNWEENETWNMKYKKSS